MKNEKSKNRGASRFFYAGFQDHIAEKKLKRLSVFYS